jgi:hypothetical protein
MSFDAGRDTEAPHGFLLSPFFRERLMWASEAAVEALATFLKMA